MQPGPSNLSRIGRVQFAMTYLFKNGHRLEAFSDGVFAIAITLLILEIHVPSAEGAGTPTLLWQALLARWPSYLALLISFATIMIAWIGHHILLQQLGTVSRTLVWINALFLLLITVIPFTTALVAEHLTHPSGRVAAAVYASVNAINCLTYLMLARVGRTASPESDGILRFASTNSLIGLALCGAAIVLAFFSPVWSLVLAALTWLSWAFPRPSDRADRPA